MKFYPNSIIPFILLTLVMISIANPADELINAEGNTECCKKLGTDPGIESSSDHRSDLTASCIRTLTTADASINCNKDNALALVPYNEENILPHQKKERTFQFRGQTLTIKQEWNTLGVAAVVWDAAIILCRYQENHPDLVQGKSVIELGAGSGLVGMVAALLGAKVMVTDRESVMEYLQKTIDFNLKGHGHTVSIETRALDWTKDAETFNETFDVVLGSDLVYIEEAFSDLLKTLNRISRADTLILLSCRIRYDRDRSFLSMMKSDFNVEEIFYDSFTDIRIYHAQKW
ncbi:hypothetical protein CHS0354_009456 [Potamilus streckersoni]|uniref:Uncharacterized protein n=1 Tax=Potamilus streckersoni TaxID=2493646 RepID=A0AAE0TIY3_9BIVA|nr:hypothetical protein CHS0354_009456 [Potamilus streckersoni]